LGTSTGIIDTSPYHLATSAVPCQRKYGNPFTPCSKKHACCGCGAQVTQVRAMWIERFKRGSVGDHRGGSCGLPGRNIAIQINILCVMDFL